MVVSVDVRPEPTISLRGISKSFVSGGVAEEILHSIDLDLYPGEVVAFLGPSGSGKSTLLNILGLLSRPDRGEYFFNATDLGELGHSALARQRLHEISFVFQAFHLIDHKDAAANVELPLIYLGVPVKERRRRVAEVLATLGLSHRARARVSTLSGGEKQRVAIARALVTSPTLLLCDEPTGSLDSARSREVIALLREVTAAHQTTVIVTHDPSVAEQCDRTISILDGVLTVEPYDLSRRPAEVFSHRLRSQGNRKVSWLALGLKEAVDATFHRLRRNMFTMLGVALGVASLVVTVGLAATISGQISSAFNVYLAQHITLTQTNKEALTAQEALELTGGSLQKVQNLNGVKSASVIRPLADGVLTVTTAPESRTDFEGRQQVRILSATPNIFETQEQSVLAGSVFNDAHLGNRGVAVISESLLRGLGVEWQPGLTLYLQNIPVTVLGVVSENSTLSDYYGAVYLPLGSDLPGISAGSTIVSIATEPGAAEQIAGEAPHALSPARPQDFAAGVPASPGALKNAIGDSQRALLLLLSVVTLVIGAVGIMNTFLVAVIERQKEIGLRLALGVPPRGIVAQFLSETSMVSLIGAMVGVVAGINLIAVISLMNRWTPIISPIIIGSGILAGLVIGVLAGIYPAWKAAKIDPVETLNR